MGAPAGRPPDRYAPFSRMPTQPGGRRDGTTAPSAADFERASRIVKAYAHATGVQARGAVMFGDEMIDEASPTMAQAIVAGAARPASAANVVIRMRPDRQIFASGALPEKKDIS